MGKDGITGIEVFRREVEEAKQDLIADWRAFWRAPDAMWNALGELTFWQIQDAKDGFDRALKEAFEAGSGLPPIGG